VTLARRTVLSFAWLLLSVVLACGYVFFGLNRIAESQAQQLALGAAVADASFVDSALLEADLLLENYVDFHDPATLAQIDAIRGQSLSRLEHLRSTTSIKRVADLVDAFREVQPQRASLRESIVDATNRRDEKAVLFFRQQRDAVNRRVRHYLRKIVYVQNEALAQSTTGSTRTIQEFRNNLVVLFLGTLAIALSIALAAARNVSRRVVPLFDMSIAVTAGDFKVRVPVEGRDEVAILAATMNDMAKQLEELEHAKDEFVALASHQLRTPATAVKANIAMLLDGYFGAVTAEQREYLQDAYDANEQQLEVIEEMLNVARIETGRLVLDRAPVDLRELAQQAAAQHRFGIADSGQQLEVQVPEHPVTLALDQKKMRMVLDNLVSNASKYSDTGARVGVRVSENPDGASVEVSDTGVGIAEEEQDRLFRKFSRVENARSVSAGGTGLGLYLAREIVRLHGGDIAVESEPGKGSTFRVVLPRS